MEEITVVIEKNIPLPTREYKKQNPVNNKYGFLRKMTVGDSVELSLNHAKGVKNTRAHKGFTYYGLMNAINKAQKDSAPDTPSFTTPTLGYGNRNVLRGREANTTDQIRKYSTRTIRIENKTSGNGVTRIVRVWRVK